MKRISSAVSLGSSLGVLFALAAMSSSAAAAPTVMNPVQCSLIQSATQTSPGSTIPYYFSNGVILNKNDKLEYGICPLPGVTGGTAKTIYAVYGVALSNPYLISFNVATGVLTPYSMAAITCPTWMGSIPPTCFSAKVNNIDNNVNWIQVDLKPGIYIPTIDYYTYLPQ